MQFLCWFIAVSAKSKLTGQLNTDIIKQSTNSIVYTETDHAWLLVRKQKTQLLT